MKRFLRPASLSLITRCLVFVLGLLPLNLPAAENGQAKPEIPALSLSVLQFGTAHWELAHLVSHGLDRANGYRLDLRLVANLPASRLAVTSGSVNGAVADLLWAQSRFAAGAPYLYVPFSAQIGDIVVADDSDIGTVADLAGRRVGVAGGPDSKGWVLLRRVAEQQGLDLGVQTDVQFGAPPLLSQALKRGQVDVIVTYWHFAARLKGEGGWRSAFAMEDLLAALDLGPQLPVLGYVFPADWAADHRALIDRFALSLKQTKQALAENPDNWQPLRELMNDPAEPVFDELRRGFIAGTPPLMTDQRLADLKQLLILTGADANTLMPDRLFYRGPGQGSQP
ncbi:ABC transporter substrate-binding protein [Marinobacter confluentis]|uniref:ABC transporter substrate-binding protein n=1 Tax=Marinobacter confluentis TaxID=1697557 RepID=A0A4Z1C386_9GAMM|nr:ABC transporter substrate-binding protein [Marinobacter confluentis]TGN40591.1 ABC transporter substrate-binding protein [Marinobacter confluentis]